MLQFIIHQFCLAKVRKMAQKSPRQSPEIYLKKVALFFRFERDILADGAQVIGRDAEKRGEVYVFQFCVKRVDGLLDFFLFSDVSHRSESFVGGVAGTVHLANLHVAQLCRGSYHQQHISRKVPCQCQKSLQ